MRTALVSLCLAAGLLGCDRRGASNEVTQTAPSPTPYNPAIPTPPPPAVPGSGGGTVSPAGQGGGEVGPGSSGTGGGMELPSGAPDGGIGLRVHGSVALAP